MTRGKKLGTMTDFFLLYRIRDGPTHILDTVQFLRENQHSRNSMFAARQQYRHPAK
jgi:hypothetical protein